MNHMNMNGANMPNGVAGGMAGMNNGVNGATPRAQTEDTEYKSKLNTYIYDYLLKNEQYECARLLLNSSTFSIITKPLGGAKKRDQDSMDTDSKDDLDLKKPADLPLPGLMLDTPTENSFLLDWFTLFWEIFLAPRPNANKGKLNPNAMQYLNHIRDQSRARQEAQNTFLRQPGVAANMQQQYNMMRMQQMPQMNDLRNRLAANPRAPLTPQQQQLIAHNRMIQQQQQQQMERAGSDVDMNGQRPRTPSSAMMPGMEGMQEFYGNPQMRQVPQNANGGGNHALQDYQMQLMLLEQQNKKRLLMARQEQDNLRPDQQGNMGGQQQFQAPGMSPQGSRSGPSPNPSEQMKRGTPKMGQAGLPASPMPDGTMPNRGSPGAMNFNNNNVPVEMMQAMGGKMGEMPMGPNGGPMRPPSSHPQGFNGPLQQQQLAQMRQAQQSGQMPNGAAWQQGPQGQPGMMNPQAAQQLQQQQQQQQGQQGQQPAQQPQGQMGTPQQRNAAMPPPQNVPAGGAAANGRPASPTQSAASTTPQQSNKAISKKKDAKETTRKRPNKKASTTAATPSAEGENPPPTPTPQTPLTPMTKGFTEQGKNGQQANTNAQAQSNVAAASQPGPQSQPDPSGMPSFEGVDGAMEPMNMDFGDLETGDVLTTFDFDAFLQDDTNQDFDISAFGYDGVEAGGDVS